MHTLTNVCLFFRNPDMGALKILEWIVSYDILNHDISVICLFVYFHFNLHLKLKITKQCYKMVNWIKYIFREKVER